jgi:hypothetical protein
LKGREEVSSWGLASFLFWVAWEQMSELEGFEATDGDGEMKKERKMDLSSEFSGPLWEDRQTDSKEISALEELMRESYENKNGFHEEWLQSLLIEGLTLDQVFDLVFDASAQPN